MPSLRGTADEAELVPPWASVFGRDHLRVVRVGLVSPHLGGTTSAWSASVRTWEGPPPRGPRQSALGRDHLRVVRVGLVSPRRFSQSAAVYPVAPK
jgi:hypothetical protein